jgi:hypothetical protein
MARSDWLKRKHIEVYHTVNVLSSACLGAKDCDKSGAGTGSTAKFHRAANFAPAALDERILTHLFLVI